MSFLLDNEHVSVLVEDECACNLTGAVGVCIPHLTVWSVYTVLLVRLGHVPWSGAMRALCLRISLICSEGHWLLATICASLWTIDFIRSLYTVEEALICSFYVVHCLSLVKWRSRGLSISIGLEAYGSLVLVLPFGESVLHHVSELCAKIPHIDCVRLLQLFKAQFPFW